MKIRPNCRYFRFTFWQLLLEQFSPRCARFAFAKATTDEEVLEGLLAHSVYLFIAAYNFCKPHAALGRKTTPAMATEIKDKAWAVESLLRKTPLMVDSPSLGWVSWAKPMKLIRIIKDNSNEKSIVIETAPPISDEISNAFRSIVATRPEWRSPAFRIEFSSGLVVLSPPTVASPDFAKGLTATLQEAEDAVTAKHKQAEAQRTVQESEKSAVIRAAANAFGIPVE